jgi:hypothetical protein
VIPTKDSRIADVFDDLRGVHPMLTCLVDGDDQGKTYARTLAAKPEPPARVMVWPDGWTIEHAVGWVLAADESILHDAELASYGLPAEIGEFPAFLAEKAHKGDEVLHGLIADAISAKPRCCVRVAHMLNVIASVAMGRDVPVDWAASTVSDSGRTTTWTFNDAVPGI